MRVILIFSLLYRWYSHISRRSGCRMFHVAGSFGLLWRVQSGFAECGELYASVSVGAALQEGRGDQSSNGPSVQSFTVPFSTGFEGGPYFEFPSNLSSLPHFPLQAVGVRYEHHVSLSQGGQVGVSLRRTAEDHSPFLPIFQARCILSLYCIQGWR